MKIWIDLSNSPHVLFFEPIARELTAMGHDIVFTARDFAQTVQLAADRGLACTVIGRNSRTALSAKGFELLGRAVNLVGFARRQGFDLAVSHNSYAQILAARSLRIPSVTLMDYEHQPANHLAFRLATKIIVPDLLPKRALLAYGADLRKIDRFAGLKEEVYLAGFTAEPGWLARLGVPSDKIVATVRPPAFGAVYHRFDNPLFSGLLDWLKSRPNVFTIIVPRGDNLQLSKRYGGSNALVVDGAVDGKNLIYHSDMVISGGGTMNREAAVLGTPAYTFFAGRMGAIDAALASEGRLVVLSSAREIERIALKKKSAATPTVMSGLAGKLAAQILSYKPKRED